MKQLDLYTATVAAFSVIALLAAALIWVSLSGPERDSSYAIEGIAWLIASSIGVIAGWWEFRIRKKPFLDLKPWIPRMQLAFSLILFFVLLSAIVFVDTWGLARILKGLIFLVLAVYLLFSAILLRRDAKIQDVERKAQES